MGVDSPPPLSVWLNSHPQPFNLLLSYLHPRPGALMSLRLSLHLSPRSHLSKAAPLLSRTWRMTLWTRFHRLPAAWSRCFIYSQWRRAGREQSRCDSVCRSDVSARWHVRRWHLPLNVKTSAKRARLNEWLQAVIFLSFHFKCFFAISEVFTLLRMVIFGYAL